MSIIPVVRMVSPDLNGRGIIICLTPITFMLPLLSVMSRIGSPPLSLIITCPVKSKLSPVRREMTQLTTSAQLVSTAANIAQKNYMETLCQICGIFSSGK